MKSLFASSREGSQAVGIAVGAELIQDTAFIHAAKREEHVGVEGFASGGAFGPAGVAGHCRSGGYVFLLRIIRPGGGDRRRGCSSPW